MDNLETSHPVNELGIDESHVVIDNPDKPCPPEILSKIVGVRVEYMDYQGYTKTGIIEVHRDLAQDVADFFGTAERIGFPIHNITQASAGNYKFDDDALMENNATSGFNYRNIADTDTPSMHGLGRAIDVNPRYNPYIIYDVNGERLKALPKNWRHDTNEAGTFTADHELVKFMEDRGWEWGGRWTPDSGRTDLHHFQKPE